MLCLSALEDLLVRTAVGFVIIHYNDNVIIIVCVTWSRAYLEALAHGGEQFRVPCVLQRVGQDRRQTGCIHRHTDAHTRGDEDMTEIA